LNGFSEGTSLFSSLSLGYPSNSFMACSTVSTSCSEISFAGRSFQVFDFLDRMTTFTERRAKIFSLFSLFYAN
jgi:hypothetical protein